MAKMIAIVTGIAAIRDLLQIFQERLDAGHKDFPAEAIGDDTLRENLERRDEAEAAVATDPTQPTPTRDPES